MNPITEYLAVFHTRMVSFNRSVLTIKWLARFITWVSSHFENYFHHSQNCIHHSKTTVQTSINLNRLHFSLFSSEQRTKPMFQVRRDVTLSLKNSQDLNYLLRELLSLSRPLLSTHSDEEPLLTSSTNCWKHEDTSTAGLQQKLNDVFVLSHNGIEKTNLDSLFEAFRYRPSFFY